MNSPRTDLRSADVSRLETRILFSAAPLVMVDGPVDMQDATPVSDVSATLTTEGDGPFAELVSTAKALAGVDEASDLRELDADGLVLERLADDALHALTDARQNASEVVFLDTSMDNLDQLLEELLSQATEARELEVVVLDAVRDGLEQITDVLAQRQRLEAIHIIGNGDGRGVQLGDVFLDASSLSAYAGKIARWSEALDHGAELLVYGSDLESTASGRELLEGLAALCHCTAAADDLGDGEGVDDERPTVASGDAVSIAEPAPAAASESAVPAPQHPALDLAFEKNLGQSHSDVDFIARGGGYTVFLTDGDAVIRLDNGESQHVVRLDLVGAATGVPVVGMSELAGAVTT